MAVASHNGTVYTFKTGPRDGLGFKRAARIATGVSLLHLDWSEDSVHLQVLIGKLTILQFHLTAHHTFDRL